MKKLILRIVTILLAFAAGAGFMSYTTYMGNRDMTAVMAEATLPVAYAEQDDRLYNEMHAYVEPMDGSYMRESVLGLSKDHHLGIAVEKYNAHMNGWAYEVRSLDGERLIENGQDLPAEDDGKYIRLELDFKDLMEQGKRYLLILTAETEEHGAIYFYSHIMYLGENHVAECVDFARRFHEAAFQKDTNHELLRKLEPDNSTDGKNYGYANIHSYPRAVVWGEMPVEQITEEKLRFTDFSGNIVSLTLDYRMQNTETKEIYQVREAYCVQYTQTQMYLQNYERTAERVFFVGSQIVEDKKIDFGIQSRPVSYRKNEEENVVGFVQQGQLWSYDFGQNRLSLVYGFEDGDDARGQYNAHDFRILQVDDPGSMDFLVYGYMNRGLYEGMCGILLCHYDALMNTVEERYFLPVDRPYEVVKEELGSLSAVNDRDTAWLSFRGMILRIDLKDCSVQILEDHIREEDIQVSEDGRLAAWTDGEAGDISLLNTRNGIVNQITTESGEILKVLGFMEDDFIYGTARREDVRMDLAGRKLIPMHRVIIRSHSGDEIREFDYAARGKYVTGVSIAENRIDLSCVEMGEDGSWTEARPEPITYTSEPVDVKLDLRVAGDEVKRSEYFFHYEGTLKNGSMKRPVVRMVLYEENRMLQLEKPGIEYLYAWGYNGAAEGFDTLAKAVRCAHEGMGTVWYDGTELLWERWNRPSKIQLENFDGQDAPESTGDSRADCLQLLLRSRQIYTDVHALMAEGMSFYEIMERELGESSCLLPGCSLRMALYYTARRVPVIGITDTGGAVLIIGYDAQNIICYEPGQTEAVRMGMKDSADMFEQAGNLFFTCLPQEGQ